MNCCQVDAVSLAVPEAFQVAKDVLSAASTSW
jgi:hypothetical protein